MSPDLFERSSASAGSSEPAQRRAPSLHSDTEIYRTVADLAKVVTRAALDMRRDAKPLIGRMLIDETMWMSVLVRRANIARDAAKLPALEELIEQTEIVQFALRTAREVGCFPTSAWQLSMPLTVAVAKQATALRNHFAPAP